MSLTRESPHKTCKCLASQLAPCLCGVQNISFSLKEELGFSLPSLTFYLFVPNRRDLGGGLNGGQRYIVLGEAKISYGALCKRYFLSKLDIIKCKRYVLSKSVGFSDRLSYSRLFAKDFLAKPTCFLTLIGAKITKTLSLEMADKDKDKDKEHPQKIFSVFSKIKYH